MSDESIFPDQLCGCSKREELRYGENPHQQAAFCTDPNAPLGTIGAAELIQGKPLSFNNIVDADTALQCVLQFIEPACVIVKHANPCGVAMGSTLPETYSRAFACDPTSAFGGVIAFNWRLDELTATTILERQFVEVIVAPEILPGAARAVLARKPDVRVLETGYPAWQEKGSGLEYKSVSGGVLVQKRDTAIVLAEHLQHVTVRSPTPTELIDILFAWNVVKYVKSNAIVYAKDGQTVGIGAGQMSRVWSAKIGIMKAEEAGLTVKGSVMASDAFFPFRDSIDAAAEAGVTAIVQPGGSIRDQEVIAAADEHSMAMVFTGIRHFRH